MARKPAKEIVAEAVSGAQDVAELAHEMASEVATDVVDTVEADASDAVAKIVKMKRHGEGYKPPHTADVHVDEVDNWAAHGWERA